MTESTTAASSTPEQPKTQSAKVTIIVAIITGLATATGPGIGWFTEHEKTKALELQRSTVTTPAGRYHWESASEGWWGYIDVDDQGAATIHMWKYTQCPNGIQKLRLFEQAKGKPAKLWLGKPGRINVSFPLQKVVYDSSCAMSGINPVVETLTGTLDQTTAYYTDELEFSKDEGNSELGGMVLMKTLRGRSEPTQTQGH